MKPLHFKHIPFTQSITDALLQDGGVDDSLYIFPTEASKRTAIRDFQNRWVFQNIQFLTMEELKALLFVSDKPLLKEEKRTLAFYASLSDTDKEFFKINNYFQSIELAHHFFDLWEEFNEEQLDDELDFQRLQEANAELLAWQIQTYDRLKTIKQNYLSFISKLGYSDAIFLYTPEHLDTTVFSPFESVMFVNQFYYTGLERHIIHLLSERDKHVMLYYQLPQQLVDRDSLEIKEFTIRDLGDIRTEHIDMLECSTDFNMLRGLVRQIHTQNIRQVVNFSPLHNPHARLLSPQRFNLGRTQNFTNTSIYQFFQKFHRILESLIFEHTRQQVLIPIQSLLDALLDAHVSVYLFGDDNPSRLSALDYLYDLIDYDYKFIDLNGEFRAKKSGHEHILKLLKFIESLLQIHSISSFIEKIDSSDGIHIDAILTQQEKDTTTIRETFYRALADFQAIDKIGIIQNWHDVFANRRLAPQAHMAAGVLLLFLDYLKSRSVRYHVERMQMPRVEFIDLQDTRNLAYKNVAVMNVVEKEIPHARQTPFLFTEKQRQVLGLKTYEDIKRREKYYFMRLVCTAPHVTLLTQKNIEENIDISSFVEELLLLLPEHKIHTEHISNDSYRSVYEHVFHPQKDYAAHTTSILKRDFYTIRLQRDRDLPNGQLNLSYYALSNLLNNAFTFYIKNLIRLDEQSKKVAADYSPMLIGNFVHECLNLVWRDLLEQNILSSTFDFGTIAESIIQNAIQKTLRQDRFYFASPHNHAHIYFEEFLLPRIQSGILQFFQYLDKIGLSNIPLDIFPEQDVYMRRDDYVPFITSDKIDFTINISGRADLRIELPEKGLYYIFDYKTGRFSREQLLLYELYYYLIEEKAPVERVFSHFYQVLDAAGKELREFNHRKPKSEILTEFEKNVRDQVNELWKNGFTLPDKRAKQDDMQDISRSDLYVTKFLPRNNQRLI